MRVGGFENTEGAKVKGPVTTVGPVVDGATLGAALGRSLVSATGYPEGLKGEVDGTILGKTEDTTVGMTVVGLTVLPT
jgi:hypothetical protein